ncbi:MAG: DUF5606 domain-containing protein [Bacteroidetes bacterium]|nr:DUF5606 domain-containing protein [Bacteroidota bacterium]
MKLDDILSIGGKPGLYKLVKATRQGVLVESLLDQKRMPISQRADVSALSDIAIYTYEEEIPLNEIYDRLFEKLNGEKAIDTKAANGEDLKAYMADFLPDYDEDRVYTSHLKKLFSWYNLLHDCDLLNRKDESAEEGENTVEAEPSDSEEKPE